MYCIVKFRRVWAFFVLCFFGFLLCGCVERQLTVNTVPPGAVVVLNDEEIGVSPVTVAFNWYGDYKVRVSKEGFETLNTHRMLEAPLHDKFPFDFFCGVLWPRTIEDDYEWSFELKAYEAPDREDLIKAAMEMRRLSVEELEKAREMERARIESAL